MGCHLQKLLRIVGLLVIAPAAWGQSLGSLQDDVPAGGSSQVRSGAHLYNAVFFTGYYSSNSGAPRTPAGREYFSGGRATVGLARIRRRSGIFLTYSPSYIRDLRYSELDSLNQSLSFTVSWKLRSGWSLETALASAVNGTTQFMFEPTLYTQITEVAATADELAAALLKTARFDNAYFASLLTGAPLLESPARQVFFGERVLNGSAHAALSHTRARWTLGLSAQATRYENIAGKSASRVSPLVPSVMAGRAGVNVSYSLSPRTEIGLNASSQRTMSRFQDTYTSMATAKFARRMSPQWFIQMHSGAGFFTAGQGVRLPGGPQYLAGGGLGFKTQAHSFLLSGERSIADNYGYRASSNVTTTASWGWGRPNRRWRIQASGSHQLIHFSEVPDMTAWIASASFSERLSARTWLSLRYSYLRSQEYAGLPGNREIHAVRLAISWTGGGYRTQ